MDFFRSAVLVSSRLSSRARLAGVFFSIALMAACYGLNISPAAAQSFAPKVDYPTGSNSFPHSIAIADINGDGKSDMAVADQFYDSVDVFINNGNGTFAAGVYYPVAGDIASIAVADFNGDGKPDLASANLAGSSGFMSVLINNGGGTFATKVDYPTGANSNPASIAAGDFNGDGKPDLAVADNQNNVVSVFMNNGSGTFAAEVEYPTDSGPSSVSIGDFNADGKPDLATANFGSNTISVLINNGGGTFAMKVDYTTGANSQPDSLAAGDFNGDGKTDLATANFNNSMTSVFINSGSGAFASKVDYPTGANPQSVAVGDFNLDNKLDLAVANIGSNTISVLINNGSGTFAPKVDYPTGASSQPISIAAGDVNADGKIDLATTNYNTSTVSVFINITPGATCAAPQSGLVAWYPGENPANSNISCNGAGCVPEIKGANTGTGRANTAYALGKVGHAFQFSTNNGSAATQVNVPDSASLRVTTGLTIEAWINPNAPGVADNPILVKGNLSSANSQPYSILFVNAAVGDNRIIFRVGNTSTFDSLVSNSNIPLNAYTHIACTYDGTTMALYVNGVSDASKTTTIGTLNQNNLPLTIGGGTADFAGAVDELGIYNVALSQSQVQAIVTADSAGKCRAGSNFPALPSYSAGEDFSVWANPSPLNGGVWSYGSAASLGSPFTLYSNSQTSVAGGALGNGYIDGWDNTSNTQPTVLYNTSNSTQTYSSTVNHLAHLLSLQPGSYSFVRWTAPSVGEYGLQGQFSGIDTAGTSTDVYIIRNYGTASQSIYFSGVVNGYSSNPSGSASFFLDFVARNAGDTIDFIVGPGTNAGTGETSPANDSTGLVAYFFKVNSTPPTAADSVISGRIVNSLGVPVAGAAINLSGTQNRKMITDANGNYRFDSVETNGFYTVTPSKANYDFSPANRSFSILGNHADAAFTAIADQGAGSNPLDSPEYFVRQQYLDFLDREPDESGFNFWSDQILGCGNDAGCTERKRISVSAAYFLSIEFQQTGGLVDGLYRASYGRRPLYAEFMPDAGSIAHNVVVGRSGWEQQLATNKRAFAEAWLQRPSFVAAFGGLNNVGFVDELIAHTGVAYSATEREALLTGLTNGTLTRAAVLQRVAEDQRFIRAKFNETFVMMEYFGYLRRDPDPSGFEYWLAKLNQFDGNFEKAEMVKAFINSGEYRQRFSQ
jgi:hypothetical protein